ncbi:AraC family transcriptional regulator [Oenococcus oeni]|uniref:AraC family transcriptional regulator n=1 Tax=Oenococcus oeni TaxID=1247 RepID=UPI0005185BAF|nr:helix-turn-helix domain-containing protein [Oenococcus oeni]
MNLNKYLHSYDGIEKKQLQNHKFIMDFPQLGKFYIHKPYKLKNELFFKNSDIYISKHHRFAPYPLHSHQFLELNFMYSGECNQIVNGRKIKLKTKDILLLDTGSKHSISQLGENDILINLLFKGSAINFDFIKKTNQQFSPSFEFIFNALSGDQYSDHKSFMLLHQNENPGLGLTLECVIKEYFFPQKFSYQIIRDYIPIIFFELARAVHVEIDNLATIHNEAIISILKNIEKNYSSITLDSLAKATGYNKNYIGNLVKTKTGKTYSQILNNQRMLHARDYLINSDLPIYIIIERIGMTNKTEFYQKFNAFFGNSPKKVRNMK